MVMKNKVLNREEVILQARTWQQQGLEVIFTNGCFDILHPGHVRYLAQSRTLGDRLIVALNDDDSVRRLKGESRPINTLADRAEVVAALCCVDAVTSFSEDTPYDLISALIPDVITKGGDYMPDNVVGADIVEEAGGKVVIIDFQEGYSTTSILKKSK
ncbi:MAG: rfaE bifunctional protein [Candidatus Parvibacillus calidus]|jgi:D-beta-D-heptose 7-phosphate kinase/D-beta-D-heptose 1-phosphate adenosyltransferase|nr:MAG: rfaE bifunctional protein [Candidatus Parvibacillus calidus]